MKELFKNSFNCDINIQIERWSPEFALSNTFDDMKESGHAEVR